MSTESGLAGVCVCVHLCLLEQTCAYWWVRTGKGLITITKS